MVGTQFRRAGPGWRTHRDRMREIPFAFGHGLDRGREGQLSRRVLERGNPLLTKTDVSRRAAVRCEVGGDALVPPSMSGKINALGCSAQ
jgi:hypothetical protein